MMKNSAMTTMKIAGALPIPNTNIATGIQATGDTGASSLTVGMASLPSSGQKRIAIPTTRDPKAASARPGQHPHGGGEDGDQHRHRRTWAGVGGAPICHGERC